MTDCSHPTRTDGRCDRCGQCEHDVILNGACLACGTTDLDPVALANKPALIPPNVLTRRRV